MVLNCIVLQLGQNFWRLCRWQRAIWRKQQSLAERLELIFNLDLTLNVKLLTFYKCFVVGWFFFLRQRVTLFRKLKKSQA